MGKKANERRRRIFAELKAAGKLPEIPRQPRPVIILPNEETVESRCCLVRHKGELPNGFRRCRDCPGP